MMRTFTQTLGDESERLQITKKQKISKGDTTRNGLRPSHGFVESRFLPVI
jgi:hypothetical protein